MTEPVASSVCRDTTTDVLHVAIMVTRRCNMQCTHCSVMSGPRVRSEPGIEELLEHVRQAASSGVRTILLTGGEPMVREDVVLTLLAACRRLGIEGAMTTNGFWGKSSADAEKRLQALRDAGLTRLTISYDRYHADHQGPAPAQNIVRAAEKQGFPVHISITRTAADGDLENFLDPFEAFKNVHFRFYDVQPVGAARQLDRTSLRRECGGLCDAARYPAITDDGRLTACNGPSYFAKPGNPLLIGSLKEETFGELTHRHRQDPILDTIRTFGPLRLLGELRAVPGFEKFADGRDFHGMCEVCQAINSNPAAVSALKARLARPEQRCERVAMQKVIEGEKRRGALGRTHANTVGACRVFLNAALNGKLEHSSAETAGTVGRADFDWDRASRHLIECGLAEALLPAMQSSALSRWAPGFVQERLRQQALAAREIGAARWTTILSLSDEFRAAGVRGVALGDTALWLLFRNLGIDYVTQSAGTIDLWVSPQDLERSRELCLSSGGVEERRENAPRTPSVCRIRWGDVVVTLRTRILPETWGLPEQRIFADARALTGVGMPQIAIPEPEALFLCESVFSTARLFVRGLRTAYNLHRLMVGCPGFDWTRLGRLVAESSVPRAFWSPVSVLSRQLALPVPSEFLVNGPADRLQIQLTTIADRRMFGAPSAQDAGNRLTRAAVLFLLQDRWLARWRCLLGVFRAESLEVDERSAAAEPQGLVTEIRESFTSWRKFKQAVARTRQEAA